MMLGVANEGWIERERNLQHNLLVLRQAQHLTSLTLANCELGAEGAKILKVRL